MKKLFFLICLCLALATTGAFAKCYTTNDFTVGTSQHHSSNEYYVYHLDTLLDSESTISIPIRYSYSQQGEYCEQHVVSYDWYKNGSWVSGAQNYTVTDTGSYMGVFLIYDGTEGGCYCNIGYRYEYLHVGYSNPTSVNELQASVGSFSISPTLSPGIFKIASQQPLTKIFVADETGRMVFTSTENISSVDISTLSDGIYFYYVEDNSFHLYRGRIVKN